MRASERRNPDAEAEGVIRDSADVIVVGSGGAGMSAAVEVLQAGGSVIVVEKMPYVGGNTLLAASAFNAAPGHGRKTL